ncbi:Lrp/AsnC family transcriptional regulator [Sphingopyxis granuli]|uniref:Lrp/AsnC family transcriptional regulator n=1 Tax=Sphingopyxis granuli TaxID=267128 RepID=UPI001F536500|nr:Lrp/AsnC family transcriptional regulator [Sphingopyxis granuli]UNK80052.1 Lrp/AsnC family transcriptional regulator [Sphingopyxis granuli]
MSNLPSSFGHFVTQVKDLRISKSIAKFIPDDLDRRLIAHLRVDGRAPLSKLADALGVARGTVQNRLDRLLATGALLGFTVRVREDYDDLTVRAVMMVEVSGKSTTQVIQRLRGIAEIRSLHTTNGNWDLVADICAPSLSDFDRVLREVRMIDGIENSETSLLLSTI